MNAKCVDLFMSHLRGADGKQVGQDYSGYIPMWCCTDDGDHWDLNIDIKTGRILNWKRPTKKQLKETFEL